MSAGHRWAGRPWAARLVKVVAFAGPFVVAVLTTIWIGQQLPPPRSFGAALGVWLLLGLVATVIVQVLDRLARRLLPFAALLQLSLAFPGTVPSRYRVARDRGGSRELQAEVDRAREHGLSDDRTEAAVTVLRLVAALSTHDRATRGHAERVRVFVDMIAEEMDVTEADIDRLRWAALLHDVGKIAVHPDVLNDPSRPSEEAWELLRTHPLEGARITAPLRPWLGHWSLAIEQHHERWDGDGYPYGLAGEELSLGARIVSVADAYDVMTAARSYKQPMAAHEAREELARHAGTQFDPEVVRAFLAIPLNRLRWAVGPLSWLASTPFGRPFQTLSSGAGAIAAAAVAAVVGAAGYGLPASAPAELPEIADVTDVQAEGGGDEGLDPDRDDGTADGPESGVDPTASPSPSVAPPSPAVAGPAPPTSSASAPADAAPPPSAPLPPPPPPSAPLPPPPPAPPPPPPPAPPRTDTLVVVGEAISAAEDDVVTVNVLANDRAGASGGSLTLVDVLATVGDVVWSPTGVVTWTPPTDFSGSVTITYVVTDGDDTAAGEVTVSVAAVNDPPLPVDDIATVDEGVPLVIDLLGNDSDPDGDSLTLVRLDLVGVTYGAVIDNGDGTITYTPLPGVSGVDTFGYVVSDGTVEATATVDVVVIAVPVAVDRPPRPGADTATVPEDGSVSIDVLANDVEEDGEPLTVVAVDLPGATTSLAGGVLTVVPAPDSSGTLSGSVTVTDGTTAVAAALTVEVLPVNDPPTITPGAPVEVAVDAGPVVVPGWATGITTGPADEAGQSLSAAVTVDQPTLFAAEPVLDPATGDLTFTLAAGASGEALATITLTDDGGTANGGVDTTVVTTTITARAVTAVDDSAVTTEDAGVVIGVLGNDLGTALRVLAVDDTLTRRGSVVDIGGGNIRYLPYADEFGTDTFTYTAGDGTVTDTATVTIEIQPTADPPAASADAYTSALNVPLVVDATDGVLRNDGDPDGDAISVDPAVTDVAGLAGVLALAADGSFTFTPSTGFEGTTSFTYTITDGTSTDDATVTITVAASSAPGELFLTGVVVDGTTSALAATAPAAADPPPDVDGDGAPGRTIRASGQDLDEDDPRRVHDWVWTPAADVVLDGPVELSLTTVTEDFESGRAVDYTIGLYECGPTGACTLLVSTVDIHVDDWSPTGTWSARTLPVGFVSETIEAGNTLRVRLLFGHRDVYVALTGDRPSSLLYSRPA